jgi:tetratricopeptide (TPR) repeat protein
MNLSSVSLTPTAPDAQLQRLLGYAQADPGNLVLRADIFERALTIGDHVCAQAQVRWALERHAIDPGWRHRLALLDMAQGEWGEAAQLLQGLIDEGRDEPVLRLNLASALMGQERNEEAVALLEPLVAAHLAALPEALTFMLRALHRQGELEEGLALFMKHEGQCQSAETFGVASLMAVDEERIDDAQRWSARALASQPSQHEAQVAAASVRLGERDAQGALRLLQAAVQRHPQDGRSWSAVGMALLLSGDLPGARDAFERAVSAIPKHIGSWHGLGWTVMFQNDMAAAVAAFNRAMELDRNFADTHGALAVAQALQGDATAAQASMRRAQGLDPSSLSAKFAQAILNGETADRAKFLEVARAALAEHRDARGRSLADVVLGRV